MSCQKPNILWLCADQQRYNTIGALGNPYIDTRNLDKLCENGVAFTHAYCQNPVCTPSLFRITPPSSRAVPTRRT